MESLGTLVIWVGCAFWSMHINKKKNRGNEYLAFAGGLCFGIFGVITNALLPSKK